jgi:Asp-tRNA(Asn)/Glu-tRNA(Gln) amidotransferase A subunit family amidase
MLSRAGVVPFAPYFDTPGPMAKDVESLAILMDVMNGRDEEDLKSEFMGTRLRLRACADTEPAALQLSR